MNLSTHRGPGVTRFRSKKAAFWACSALAVFAALPLHAQESGESGSFYKGNAQRTGATSETVALPLNLLWRYTVALPDPSVYPSANSTAPLVTGAPGARRISFIFGKKMYTVDAESGAKISEADLGGTVSAPLTLLASADGDFILSSDEKGYLSARRAADLQEVWRVDAGASRKTAPLLLNTANGTRIVVFSDTGEAKAYDPSGKLDEKWTVSLGAAAIGSPLMSADGKTIYVATANQTIVAIDAAKRTTRTIVAGGRIADTPILLGDTLYVNVGDKLSAFEVKRGRQLWSTPVDGFLESTPSGMATGGVGRIYGGTNRGQMMSFDAKTGKILWQTDLNARVTGTPLVTPNAVLVGTRGGVFYSLDPNTGAVQWTYRLRAERQHYARDTTGTNNRWGGGTNNNNTRNNRNGGNNQNNRGGSGRNSTSNQGGRNNRSGNTGTGGTGGRNNRIGGNTIGGAGGRFGNANTLETVTYGVSSAPILVDGMVYLLGNNAAIYALGQNTFDAEPPRLLQPTITILSREEEYYPQLISTRGDLTVLGRAPVFFTAEIDDQGSGIDPTSVRVSVNGVELPAEDIEFNSETGVLTATLTKEKAGTAQNLDDGQAQVVVQARDYRGNAMTYNGNFTVDNNLEAPTTDTTVRVGANPGMPGMPGMNPGMNPNMPMGMPQQPMVYDNPALGGGDGFVPNVPEM